MQSYDLYLPTHLVFGRGRVNELGNLTAMRVSAFSSPMVAVALSALVY